VGSMDALLAVLRTSEGSGVWHGSYAADGWTWIWGSRVTLSTQLAALKGNSVAPAPENPYPDYEIMTYETDEPNPPTGTPTFPFSSFNASVAFDLVPRFVCAGDIPPTAATSPTTTSSSSSCNSTWVGVSISSPSLVGFFTAQYKARGSGLRTAVFYTTDGSNPTPSSGIEYSQPFTVSGPATITAATFDKDSGDALSTASVGVVISG